MEDGPTAVSTPRKIRRLPFKPTALRKDSLCKLELGEDCSKASADQADGAEDDGLSLFMRSKEMEPIVAADRLRSWEKSERLRLEEERDESSRKQSLEKRSTPGSESPGWKDPVSVDQSRSMDVNDKLEMKHGLTNENNEESILATPPMSKRSRFEGSPPWRPSHSRQPDNVDMPMSPSARASQSHSQNAMRASPSRNGTPKSKHAVFVNLDSDESDTSDEVDEFVAATPSQKSQNEARGSARDAAPPDLLGKEVEEEEEEQEEEFAKYIREAEAQRLLDQASQPTDAKPLSVEAKQKVTVLVTSEITGAQPCLFNYLYSQPLRLLRNTWVALQRQKGVEMALQQDDDVILTWRRKKVYAYSTLTHLGIRQHGEGDSLTSSHGRDGLSEDCTRVHMEAWTPELFQQMELDEARRAEREDAGASSDEGDADEVVDEVAEVKIRLTLRARGLEDVRLTARPGTTVETLVMGFRNQRQMSPSRDVKLSFDGDILEEHVTMADAGIDDLDCFEVYVR